MKKIIFILFCIITLCGNAQMFAPSINGIELIEQQNIQLINGGCVASPEPVKDDMYAVRVYADLDITGWIVNDDLSNLQFIWTVNDTPTEIDINQLNNGNKYTHFTVIKDGHTTHLSFSHAFWVSSWDDIYKMTWSIRCYYNDNWHQGVLKVKQNGIVTGVHEISTASSDEMFDLMGHKITHPNKGQIYIKNHQKFLQR